MNKTIKFLIFIITVIGFAPSCSTRHIALNPFNPNYKLLPNESSSTQESSGMLSTKSVRAGDIALNAVSRPIPGALPTGAGIGISTALFLFSPNHKPIPLQTAENANFLIPHMPKSEAVDENEAEYKMGLLIEKAVAQALGPTYQTKDEISNDNSRWLRVNGPLCENWSCQIVAPILQNKPTDHINTTTQEFHWNGKEVYGYSHFLLQNRSVGFVKITKEYDSKGLVGSTHVVEGSELPGFDYKSFYQRVSTNLPDWVAIQVTMKGKEPYQLFKGIQSPVIWKN
jgi:hypothetical protein